MERSTILVVFLTLFLQGTCQQTGVINSFFASSDVKVTIDRPAAIRSKGKLVIVFYALPNGNTTAQTMGKQVEPGDDWHFDIQHIRAQTAFIRNADKKRQYVVIYLENKQKSWPAWKREYADFRIRIPRLIDSLAGLFQAKEKHVYLNGHSGGGSFIFGYLSALDRIPSRIKRISFLDSNYGYDSSFQSLFKQWLREVKGSALNVFAYNDSIALYNGKPFVSPTGGTWYRSHLMLKHFQNDFSFTRTETDSLVLWKGLRDRVQFFFKKNPDRGIYHTQQVELNGFIHSIFCGTRFDSENYRYYGKRAYGEYIFGEVENVK